MITPDRINPVDDPELIECLTCRGVGWWWSWAAGTTWDKWGRFQSCPVCDGTGLEASGERRAFLAGVNSDIG